MTRNRVLSIAVVVLVLLNIATLSVHFMHGPMGHRPPRGGPKHIIIERLHFDADQVAAYEDLIREHRQHVDPLDQRLMELRSSLYGSSDVVAADSLAQLIGATQSEMERVHAAHFAQIRALCRPDQLPLYDDLSHDLAQFFHPGPPPPRERQ